MYVSRFPGLFFISLHDETKIWKVDTSLWEEEHRTGKKKEKHFQGEFNFKDSLHK